MMHWFEIVLLACLGVPLITWFVWRIVLGRSMDNPNSEGVAWFVAMVVCVPPTLITGDHLAGVSGDGDSRSFD